MKRNAFYRFGQQYGDPLLLVLYSLLLAGALTLGALFLEPTEQPQPSFSVPLLTPPEPPYLQDQTV